MIRRTVVRPFAVLLLLVALCGAAVAHAEIEQVGNLRITVNGELTPQTLPREGKAPIAVAVGWNIGTTDATEPPQLKTLKIEINRNGLLDSAGLPICAYGKIQPATTSRALSNCRSALVGRGNFSAIVGLEGQESYLANGQMLVFNGVKGGKPVLYGQIYSPHPFSNSFVITFKVSKSSSGTYGTALTAILPPALRDWGNLTEIDMRLSRNYTYKGSPHSFLSAGCPTPKGVGIASFKLARTSFDFVGGQKMSSTLTRSCKARN